MKNFSRFLLLFCSIIMINCITSVGAFAQIYFDYYYTINITGPSTICPDGTTAYIYTGSTNWQIEGGTITGYNGNDVTVVWTSESGSLYSWGEDQECWYDPEIMPPVLYCNRNHYGSNYLYVNSHLSPRTPSGGSYCQGGNGVNVTITASQTGVSYQLKINGSNSGLPLLGNGGIQTWVNQMTAGTYTVASTKSSVGCTVIGGNAPVVISPLPDPYTLSGGGAYCSGGSGVNMALSGSQGGINYQLKVGGGGNSGSPVAGTGSALTWTNRTVGGEYTVVATNLWGCSRTMSGFANVNITPLPSSYSVGGGGSYCSGGTGTSVTLSGSEGGVNYQLKVNGANSGAPIPATGIGMTWNNQTTAGNYTVLATYGSTGCFQTMGGSTNISVTSLPNTYTVGGGGSYCNGEGGRNITLSGSQNGVNYQLKVNGSNAGTQPGIGGPLTWYLQQTGGTYTVVATHATNGCFQTMDGSPSITVNPLPVQYIVGGGGGYCSGESGTSITLSGSQAGVNYQLKANGSNSGSAIAGTGNSLTWNNQTTAGTYTVVATNASTGCLQIMSGSPSVSINTLPTAYVVSGGGSYCSGGNGVSIVLSGSETGVNYQLKVNSSNTGSPVAGTGSSLTWTGQTTAGTYTVTATRATTGCNRSMNGNAGVSINPLPTLYALGGGGGYCAGGTGVSVELSGSESGVNYQLKVGGANTGDPIPGNPNGSPISWNNQTTGGTYSVAATNAVTGCSKTMNGSPVITISPIPVITNNSSNNYVVYGGAGVSLTTGTYPSYSWSRNGVAIGGETLQNFSAKEPGHYFVTVISASVSCSSAPFIVYNSLDNQPSPVNIASTTNIFKEGLNENSSLYYLNADELAQAVVYSDGLGRAFQSVAVGQSPQSKDVIAASGYSRNGLIDSAFLSYIVDVREGHYRVNALRGAPSNPNSYNTSEQYSFYQNTPKVASDIYPYARTVYRNTPDAKVIEQGAPGSDWQPGSTHTVRNSMALNDATTFRVRYWDTSGSTTSNYPANSVTVSITTDENNNQVRTFTNTLGQTVLKQAQIDETLEGIATAWLETYYIYDQFGRLIYIVPPKAMKVLGTGASISATTFSVSELIHRYTYDNKNRLIIKKEPGSAEQYFVYDHFDRPVLTQDANTKALNKWLFTKYDVYGRAVQQGLYFNHRSRTSVQDWVNQAYTSSPSYPEENYVEDRSSTSGSHGYTNRSFPKDSIQYLSVNYYDSYDFNFDGVDDFAYNNAHLQDQESSNNMRVRGRPTGSKKAMIDEIGVITSYWLTSVVFYDQYDRPIQVRSNNLMSCDAGNLITAAYDFSGKVLKTKSTSAANRITWQNLVGATSEVDRLSSTATTPGWFHSGASSVQQIPANTDGWIQTTVTEITRARMFGLSGSDPDQNYTSMNYAFYLSGASLFVYENGTPKLTVPGGELAGDVLRIERTGSIIRYYKNSILVYTSDIPSASLLMGDVAFHSIGADIGYTQISTAQATALNTQQRYTYDHAGRPLAIYHTIDSNPEQQVAAYEYNALGQLVDKKLHNTGGSNFLQSIDYRYTIRGWMKSINNAQLTVDPANDESNDFFGLEIAYNNSESGLSNNLYYNGNISALKWKGPGQASGATDQRSYKYLYDKSDRLKTATFQAHGGSTWDKETATLNESLTYDHNGNIKELQRNQNQRGLSGVTVTNTAQTIDNLAYTYANNNNWLTRVDDATANTAGFKNGASNNGEYSYSTGGSLLRDDNKGITAITYNVLGKPRQMTFSDGRKVQYVYDASGNKLKTKTWQGTVAQTVTEYEGDLVYENGTLNFFSSPEGRVVKNGGSYEYQYAISDHQGNTRVVFSSVAPAPESEIATFEDPIVDGEAFSNVPDASPHWVTHVGANHTPAGEKVIRLNQNLKTGPGRSLKVYAGDKVDMEVWTYFENNSGFGSSSPVGTLITAVAWAFGGVSGGGGESGLKYDGVNSALNGFGIGGSQGDNLPGAYLNYILFDQNYKVLTAGWEAVPATALNSKQLISIPTLNVREAGYIFVYLSYETESNNYVQFDDFKVTHTKSQVIQYNEYYPFGMQTANSWTRENHSNNELYNGSTELNSTSGLYDLMFRQYDPVLGRFTGVDPLASKYPGSTPYNYAFNDPVFWNDPSGADPVTWDDIFDIVDELWEDAPMDGGSGWTSSDGFTGGYGYDAAVSYGTAYNAMFSDGGGSIVPTYSYRIVETSSSFSTQTWTGYKERYISGFTHKPGGQTGLAILIAFPDREADIPDNGDISDEVGSWFDDDGNGKLKVGHAGVVIVNPDGEGNNTYYFDYGRYGSDANKGKGRVRSSDYDGRLKVPNWKSDLTVEENINRIVSKIADQRKSKGAFENYGRIAAAVYGGLNYQAMYDYARSREAEGLTRFSCPFGNYCARFARQVVDAGGGWFGPHIFTGEQNVKSAGTKIYKID